MLLRFRVANSRSLRDECELSLVNGLPVAAVFGANASGKTSLLRALFDMREAVRTSFAEWATRPGVPRQPFKLEPGAADETTLYEVDVMLGANPVRYTYGFELSDERVEAEWLHAYPEGERVIWFDREADRPDSEGGEYVFPGSELDGLRETRANATRPDALFLSTAATLNDPQFSFLHRWFVHNLQLITPGQGPEDDAWTRRLLLDAKRGEEYRERLAELLSMADLGISGIDVDRATGRIALRHGNANGNGVALDFLGEESQGTHALFAFLGPMLAALDASTVLLVDDLSSSIHPALTAEIVRLFRDPRANPRGAQLLFTTHDATLLGNAVLDPPLAREQVWLTQKDSSGATELYPLLAAARASDEDLGREYLRGRYGGSPRISAGRIPRALTHRPWSAPHQPVIATSGPPAR